MIYFIGGWSHNYIEYNLDAREINESHDTRR